ncbi:hypothetical protein [Flaviaesturariibacter aridisoli]|uniref:Uncharacterized protein n=1 Tax=Flaviaesturariibacter aridisoli TaxID=2545761 RepID=A0A4R4E1G5_9BACT|nr:hypothetical protein [Flaviaesturariibacter aridisoli]TCZ73324.1 hypothetical protein E0486_06530 [Flaviaesturariibacter aridisoli]
MRFAPFLLLACLFAITSLQAQQRPPAYAEVVRSFFRAHSFTEEGAVLLHFAKRPEGWTVQIQEGMNFEVRSEVLYWPTDSTAGRQLAGFEPAGSAEEQERSVERFLNGGLAQEEYCYDRFPVYGYDGWERDLIGTYGAQPVLRDTLLDALARAYSSYGDLFLNRFSVPASRARQFPLQARLAPLEKPGLARIDSALAYYRLAIATFRRLCAANPAYITRVGNAPVKQFNEELHVWSMMDMNGYPERGRPFLDSIHFDENLRRTAHNYLDACPPNAVLFTYGDNDTYPLWYVQQKEGYRTDVTVVNTSLAGVPIYVQSLAGSLRFDLPKSLYGKSDFLYVPVAEPQGAPKAPMTLKELIRVVSAQAALPLAGPEDPTPYRIPGNRLVQRVDAAAFRTIHPDKSAAFAPAMNWTTGSYLTLDQLLVFDVIQSNLAKRPILFTSKDPLHAGYLVPEGTAFRLTPMTALQQKKAAPANALRNENFLLTKFEAMEFDRAGAALPSAIGTGWLIDLYTPLIAYHATQNPVKARKLYATLKERQPLDRFYSSSLFDLGFTVWTLSDRKEGLALLTTALNKLRPEHLAETPGLDPYPAAQWDALRQWVLDELRKRKATESELNALVDATGPLFP